MKDGFVRAAAAAPGLRVADCAFNTKKIIETIQAANKLDVKLLVFPELSITAATCGDLFFSPTLLAAAEAGLSAYLAATADLPLLSVVGLPVRFENCLCSAAAVCSRGKLLGIVPKTAIPPMHELNQSRHFSVPTCGGSVMLCGQFVPLSPDLLFTAEVMPDLCVAVGFGDELGADYSTDAGRMGKRANVILTLSASPEIIGRETMRRRLLETKSAMSACGIICAEAGRGESTTDLVFGGHCLIAEEGQIPAERPPFSTCDYIAAEIDIARLTHARLCGGSTPRQEKFIPKILFDLPLEETRLTRVIDPHPFIPTDPTERAARASRILTIQAHGLAQRIERAFAHTCVIAISGGLDSCLALLATVRAMDLLGRPRTDIIAVTMPCFGTTRRTRSNAELLCAELGVTLRAIDIMDAVKQHFRDIGHDPDNHNVVYENSQARERTQIIMDIANAENGLVIGTGDLSELALGWATYNGDHMSNYGVNASIPKTLVRHLVAWYADDAEPTSPALAACLRDILATPVSPELLPPKDGEIAQITEDLVGPYELHDFYLYHFLRYAAPPTKLFRLARAAFGDTYDDATLLHWLETFHRRFFSQQFKRSCLPDGPKVGSVCVSPRGAWQMPSDTANTAWMAEIAALKADLN